MRPLLVLSLVLAAGQVSAQTVTFASLLDEMVSREQLARLPLPPYTCKQASSYDRDSKQPGKPGWFANWDRSQFVRVEEEGDRKEYVLLDEAGPGAIVRFWGTWHGPKGQPFSDGTLRVYLDGNAEPVIEGPITRVLDGGGIVGPPLSQGVSPKAEYRRRGHNLYLPIPYAKHCKITYETSVPVDRGGKTGEALYYQINFRTYPRGTQVESFSMDRLAAQEQTLGEIQERLLRSRPEPDAIASEVQMPRGALPAGGSRSLTIRGPAALGLIQTRLYAPDRAQALRSTVVEIEFDGQRTVWCPVGALFGSGYESEPFRTWYTQRGEDGTLSCFWRMPFAKSCRLTLHNAGEQDVDVRECTVRYADWSWDDRSMHFWATWHQLTEADTSGERSMDGGAAARDVNYVTVDGRGVYAGDTLEIFNGADAWWGEGDEKIWVDGEDFPSHFGTGTEDYYGYAWCRPETFDAPFHAQPCGSGNLTAGFSVNSRYRALDAIPFEKQLQVDMELWHWASTKVNYAPATFFYARPGASCNVEPDPETVAQRVPRERRDIVEPFVAEGAIEGESLEILKRSGGTTEVQRIDRFGWSDDAQLWWRDNELHDRLVLALPAPAAGRYEIVANLSKAADYGIVEISINGEKAGEFDRYHNRVAHDEVVLGTFDLRAGQNLLTIAITGANDKAEKRYMFGLDYLKLTPQSR